MILNAVSRSSANPIFNFKKLGLVRLSAAEPPRHEIFYLALSPALELCIAFLDLPFPLYWSTVCFFNYLLVDLEISCLDTFVTLFATPWTTSVTMRSSSLISSFMLLGLTNLTHAATLSSSCYYPSGALAPSNDVPCNTDTDGHSACCSEGVACLSSGLCFDNGIISRGSCTDQDYADEACASACTDCKSSQSLHHLKFKAREPANRA